MRLVLQPSCVPPPYVAWPVILGSRHMLGTHILKWTKENTEIHQEWRCFCFWSLAYNCQQTRYLTKYSMVIILFYHQMLNIADRTLQKRIIWPLVSVVVINPVASTTPLDSGYLGKASVNNLEILPTSCGQNVVTLHVFPMLTNWRYHNHRYPWI